MAFHVAARLTGPQRGPARPHGGQQGGLIGNAEKALELPGEARAFAILDQRRGTNSARRLSIGALRVPRSKQRRGNIVRYRLLIKGKPDVHRQAASLGHAGGSEVPDCILKPKRLQLRPISVGGQRKTAGRRQPSLCQRCKIGSLGPYTRALRRVRTLERNDQRAFCDRGHQAVVGYATFSAIPMGQLTPVPPSPQ